MHVAAIHGHLDILRHLYWYGADINAREGKSGYTALHYALERGDERLADFLLRECSSKLDATILTYGRRSVLEVGCAVSPHIQQVLLSRGVQYTTYSSDEEYDSDDSDDEVRINAVNNLAVFPLTLQNDFYKYSTSSDLKCYPNLKNSFLTDSNYLNIEIV